ncbi:FMN-dependent NADH-azoreductase [Chelativorans salis]|uniref:FMN dependent NADH:quinone oxidoreductase n=1 Tax=Chelativorans salis TaxID=2978478 RepID=A0ABT2LYI6_9HYPH|nr:FMN-dependent NADH-azoreductase [Chelativorans sp. EGI FJ00035]MCT7378274.1 FMN-dependent NADH-azoreductase [Chelativorans sp. EGI FJ00035]
MTSILLVTSSPRGEASHSTRLATELADKLRTTQSAATLVKRDLVQDPLPHIEPDFASGIYTPADDRSEKQARLVAVSDAAVDEVLAADTIVIATGIINFSISSTLKSWLDHVARAGRTFRYTESGPEGLVKNKKVYLVVASGGVYSQGAAAVFDHAVPYLKTLLTFLGMSDIEVIRIEGVGMGAEAEQRALSSALNVVSELAMAA